MNKRGSPRKNGTLVVVEIVPSVGGSIQSKTAVKSLLNLIYLA
jgi:hypothetical protein